MSKTLTELFHKHIRLIQTGLVISFVALTFYLLLLIFDIPVPYVMLSNLHQLILLNGELLILVFLYKKYLFNDQYPNRFLHYARDFLIINCVFLFPFIKFYTNPIRTEIQIILQIRPYLIIGYLILLMVMVIVLHRLNNIKQAKLWLNHQIDNQKFKDIESIEYRSEQLQKNEPGLSRTPFFWTLFKKIQREGVGYLIAVVALAACGLILRLWQLDGLPPYIDEFNHLNAAKAIYQGLSLSQVGYRRSLYVVTLPVSIFFQFFGVSLWTARLAGVLVNTLGLIPLYWLSKRINKQIALIAVGLYVFSPWVIATSRNVREYAYYPLVFYSIALIITKLYEAFPERIVFYRDYRILLKWNVMFYLSILVFSLYFAMYIDNYSTSKMLLLFYPVFGILLARKIDWENSTNKILSLILLTIGLITFTAALYFAGGQFLTLNYVNRNYLFFSKLFFEMPAQQWYFNHPLISIIIFVLAIIATPLLDKKKFVLPFALLSFLGGGIAISLLFLKGERPRYAINIELWFVILVATGLFCAFKVLGNLLNNRYRLMSFIILLLLFWNVPQTLKSSMHQLPGWHPITDEFHADIAPALSYLQSKVSEDDVLVTTGYVANFKEFFLPDLIADSNLILYDHYDPNSGEKIYAAMDTYINGWIALEDSERYMRSHPIPLKDFVYKDKQVEYMGWYGNVFILRWDGE